MISRPSLCDACASGNEAAVNFLIELDDTDLDALSHDGISPLCTAATWGYDNIVRLLVDAACDPNVRNSDGMGSTALHMAACQENGKIVHVLLAAGADATLQDGEGRTACDFASVSDAMWPLFAARGLPRTSKETLIQKRVIRRIASLPGGGMRSDDGSDHNSSDHTVTFCSRPGSAYTRAYTLPSCTAQIATTCERLSDVPECAHVHHSGVDPLEHSESVGRTLTSEPNFSLWRDL